MTLCTLTFRKINSDTFSHIVLEHPCFPKMFFFFKFHVSHCLLNVPSYHKQFQVIWFCRSYDIKHILENAFKKYLLIFVFWQFMPQYKTALDHIQDKTDTTVGRKTTKIRLHLIQIFLYGLLSANQLWFEEICPGESLSP